MNGQTITEKIISRAAGKSVRAGDVVVCHPDLAMATDGSFPMAIDYLAAMEPVSMRPIHPDKVVLALDHYDDSSGAAALALQDRARQYAQEFGLVLHEAGEGVGHQLMLESGRIQPGMLIVGADSHSTTYSALNCFSTGIGSSDLAGFLLCGAVWLRVPMSLQVRFEGCLQHGVSGKDVALALAALLDGGKANYLALEFGGNALNQLSMQDRFVISNMAVEYGAKAAIFPFDAITETWVSDGVGGAVHADADAHYCDELVIDLNQIQPQLARPHSVGNVVPLNEADNVKVDTVYIGTCTAGRYEDFLDAFSVIRANGGISPHVRLIVTPASWSVQERLEKEGVLAQLVQYGATLQPPGCGSCCGTAGYRPADGEVVVSTANRNFKGRMGNANAMIYLASPQTCARVACTGYLIGTEAA